MLGQTLRALHARRQQRRSVHLDNDAALGGQSAHCIHQDPEQSSSCTMMIASNTPRLHPRTRGCLCVWVAIVCLGASVIATTGRAAGPSRRPANGPSMAVLDTQSIGVDDTLLELIEELLVDSAIARGYQVLTRRELLHLFGGTPQSKVVKCTELDCMLELGGALGVQYLVASQLGLIGSTWALHLKLIDIDSNELVRRSSRTFPGNQDRLFDAVGDAVYDLLPVAPPAPADDPAAAMRQRSGWLRALAPAWQQHRWVLPASLTAVGGVGVGIGAYLGLKTRAHHDAAWSTTGVEQAEHSRTGMRLQRQANLTFASAALALASGALSWVLAATRPSDGPATAMTDPTDPTDAPDRHRTKFGSAAWVRF